MKSASRGYSPNAHKRSPMTRPRTDWFNILRKYPGMTERDKWEHLCLEHTYQEIADMINGKRRKRGGISKTTVRLRAKKWGVTTGRMARPRLGYKWTTVNKPQPKFNYAEYLDRVNYICIRDYDVTVREMADLLAEEWISSVGFLPDKVDVPNIIHLEAVSMMEA